MKPVRPAFDELKLTDLAAFVATAEAGNISRAARENGFSQSALSRRILDLEAAVGGRLFGRDGRGIHLTELGSALLPKARELMDGARRFIEDASCANAQPVGTVRIALPRWASAGAVSDLVERVSTSYPKIRLVIQEGYSRDVRDGLASGKIDVGVFNLSSDEQAVGQKLFTSALVLVGRRGSPLLSGDTVVFRRLSGLSLAIPPMPNAIQRLLRDVATRLDVRIDVDLEVDSGAMLDEIVSHSDRYTIRMIESISAAHHAERLKAATIVEPSLILHTYCATGAKHLVSRASLAVEACVVEVLRAHHAAVVRSNPEFE